MLFWTRLVLLLFFRFELLLLLLQFFIATEGPLEVRFTHSHVRSNISGHSGAALSLNLSLGVQVFNRVMSNRAMTHSEVCLCTMSSTRSTLRLESRRINIPLSVLPTVFGCEGDGCDRLFWSDCFLCRLTAQLLVCVTRVDCVSSLSHTP